MFTRGSLRLLVLNILSACPVIPTGPRVLVLPAVGKPMAVFQADAGACQSDAQQQLGVTPAMTLQERYDMASLNVSEL